MVSSRLAVWSSLVLHAIFCKLLPTALSFLLEDWLHGMHVQLDSFQCLPFTYIHQTLKQHNFAALAVTRDLSPAPLSEQVGYC